MLLSELLKNFRYDLVGGTTSCLISKIFYDSRVVTEGGLFFAIEGTKLDGHDFLEEAILKGAKAIVVSNVKKAQKFKDKVTIIKVDDTRLALAELGAVFYGHPSQKISVIGVTGTNGKTTTTYFIEQILTKAGYQVGLIGTIENRIGEKKLTHKLTTPESLDLQEILAEMVNSGCHFAVMEVSSHSIALKRVLGVKFVLKILTNITQDHLDFHKTFDEYKKVKINWMNEGDCLKIWPEDWSREKIPEGFLLPGRFNYENAQTAKAAGRALGIKEEIIDLALIEAKPAPGRFEIINPGQDFLVIVDYAHTPDGLEKLIRAAKEISKGKVITVFGCGGDRDRSKRPKMGYISGLLSDYTIITSDNPRSEEPINIILEIEAGLKDGLKVSACDHYSQVLPSLKIKSQSDFFKNGGGGYEIEPDRAKAIERAITLAQKGDIVLLAGKGHEDYQIFKDKIIHFDDREVAKEVLKKKVITDFSETAEKFF